MGGGMEGAYGGYGGGEAYYDDGSYGSYGGMAMGGGSVGGGAGAGMSMVPMMLPNGQVRPPLPAPGPLYSSQCWSAAPNAAALSVAAPALPWRWRAMALVRMPCSSQAVPIISRQPHEAASR